MKKEQTLEDLFFELDELVKRMEEREVSLEESFQLYCEGMKKLKLCNDKIDMVEKKIMEIDENGVLHEFE